MALEQKQQQKQSVALLPQMLQSMSILQMGIQELREYTEEILQENPTLEFPEEAAEPAAPYADAVRRLEWLEANDCQNAYYHRQDEERDDGLANLGRYSDEENDLSWYILSQFMMGDGCEPEGLRASEFLGERLDANGFLDGDAAFLAATAHMDEAVMERAAAIAAEVTAMDPRSAHHRDRVLDRLLTSRATGIPVMLGLLALVLWLTMAGANVPSQLLSGLLMGWQEPLRGICETLNAPWWLTGALVDGVYRTVAWVVSVMLPPMAIFFPLFTLLEDAGYLPRVAFNLDHFFQKSGAHGRQSLTMCMGLGCNACGVMGCRIIQSPRERLIAIVTNAFVPCNGRFPTLIALISMFFVAGEGLWGSFTSAAMLMGAVVLSVAMTLWASRFLSRTVLKGEPSSFSLELPPYRMPQVGQVLVRSILDRTLFVLGRAVAVAAPAGLLIWTAANVSVGGESVLLRLAGILEPLGRLMGLDGIILLAFLLGFPANEIVVPCILMGYLSTGTLTDYGSLAELQELLAGHGWTAATALSALLFTLFHFPCGTTCLTIWRETRSWKWTALAVALPTCIGAALCVGVHLVWGLLA